MTSSLVDVLEDAWQFRKEFHSVNPGQNAYRVFCGADEGIRGLLADRYGDLITVSRFMDKHACEDARLSDVRDFFLSKSDVRSVYLKELPTDRSHAHPPAPRLLGGTARENAFTVLEGPFRFQVRPLDGFGSGLFMDQRSMREYFYTRVKNQEVLNTFAYTCSFSVACALGGARVTSVDLSKKYLDWGRDNFSLNDINPNDHEFFANDTLGFLQGAHKRGRRFDTIILDPPSFSRTRKGVFSVRKDAPRLLKLAANVLKRNGTLYFSSNLSDWADSDLQSLLKKTLRDAELLPLPAFPKDFEWQLTPVSRALARLSREVFA